MAIQETVDLTKLPQTPEGQDALDRLDNAIGSAEFFLPELGVINVTKNVRHLRDALDAFKMRASDLVKMSTPQLKLWRDTVTKLMKTGEGVKARAKKVQEFVSDYQQRVDRDWPEVSRGSPFTRADVIQKRMQYLDARIEEGGLLAKDMGLEQGIPRQFRGDPEFRKRAGQRLKEIESTPWTLVDQNVALKKLGNEDLDYFLLKMPDGRMTDIELLGRFDPESGTYTIDKGWSKRLDDLPMEEWAKQKDSIGIEAVIDIKRQLKEKHPGIKQWRYERILDDGTIGPEVIRKER